MLTDNENTRHAGYLLRSFQRVVGQALLPPLGDALRDAQQLFSAPFVVLSHGIEADPILNYGNALALQLWEMTAAQFCVTPSRITAEPTMREDRQHVLDTVARQGYITGYAGIRVSASGRRFLIENVVLWNVSDDEGNPLGQAASFDRWSFLHS
jgi:hypothetical protein